jgi:hypoxanthine phosphoribosyltransferase
MHVLIDASAIDARLTALAQQIQRDAGDEPLHLVAVLKGAFVFLADLVRAIPIDHEIDFMAVASYGASTRSSGIVRIVKDLDIDLEDRHVLIIEDIVDSGLTLAYLRRMLASRNPASLEVCALLARETISPADRASLRYVGFTIPPEFVVGYGLDLAERYRNLPDVHVWDGPGEAAGPGPAGTAG